MMFIWIKQWLYRLWRFSHWVAYSTGFKGRNIYGWPSNYITLSTTFEYILDFWRKPLIGYELYSCPQLNGGVLLHTLDKYGGRFKLPDVCMHECNSCTIAIGDGND